MIPLIGAIGRLTRGGVVRFAFPRIIGMNQRKGPLTTGCREKVGEVRPWVED